jgi:hypothetical protein
MILFILITICMVVGTLFHVGFRRLKEALLTRARKNARLAFLNSTQVAV